MSFEDAWLAASAASLAAWSIQFAATLVVTRPRRAPAGPETLEHGDEPPAVVNLLTEGFRVTTEAVPATLLDLAARGLVGIDLVGAGSHVVRVERARPQALVPYEQMVLEHVRRRAVGGVVPAEALTTGPEDASRRWWHAFRAAVVSDAQARGLCTNRLPLRTLGRLWGTAAIVALPLFLTLEAREDRPGDWQGMLVLVAHVGALAALGWATLSGLQRDTDPGLEASSRWLGVRAALAANERFAEAPASAVAIWGRHLAYGAAMGVCPAAVRGLPLGAEDAHEAWSARSGRWRRVHVSYPRFRPAWGAHPGVALVGGIAWGLPAAVAFGALWPFRGPGVESGLSPQAAAWFDRILLLLGSTTGLATMVAAGVVVAAILSATGREEITGRILRLRDRPVVRLNPWRRAEKRRCYVAIDDGTGDAVTALSIRPGFYDQLGQGDEVTMVVTAVLRHVESFRPAGPSARAGRAAPP